MSLSSEILMYDMYKLVQEMVLCKLATRQCLITCLWNTFLHSGRPPWIYRMKSASLPNVSVCDKANPLLILSRLDLFLISDTMRTISVLRSSGANRLTTDLNSSTTLHHSSGRVLQRHTWPPWMLKFPPSARQTEMVHLPSKDPTPMKLGWAQTNFCLRAHATVLDTLESCASIWCLSSAMGSGTGRIYHLPSWSRHSSPWTTAYSGNLGPKRRHNPPLPQLQSSNQMCWPEGLAVWEIWPHKLAMQPTTSCPLMPSIMLSKHWAIWRGHWINMWQKTTRLVCQSHWIAASPLKNHLQPAPNLRQKCPVQIEFKLKRGGVLIHIEVGGSDKVCASIICHAWWLEATTILHCTGCLC